MKRPRSQHAVRWRHFWGHDWHEQEKEAQTFKWLQVVENERGGFCFPLKAGVWFPVRLWLGKQRHAQGACFCMEMPDDRLHYEQAVAEQWTLKWPLIDHETRLLWNHLLCKPAFRWWDFKCVSVRLKENRNVNSILVLLLWSTEPDRSQLDEGLKVIYYRVSQTDIYCNKHTTSLFSEYTCGLWSQCLTTVSVCLGASCGCRGRVKHFVHVHPCGLPSVS